MGILDRIITPHQSSFFSWISSPHRRNRQTKNTNDHQVPTHHSKTHTARGPTRL